MGSIMRLRPCSIRVEAERVISEGSGSKSQVTRNARLTNRLETVNAEGHTDRVTAISTFDRFVSRHRGEQDHKFFFE